MAKEKKMEQIEKTEMTADEAKTFRASLAKPQIRELTESQRREAFRVFWAKAKRQYGKAKDIEGVIWLHLKSMKMDQPEKFEDGLKHFGLKKIK
jgi:hypothetical protein